MRFYADKFFDVMNTLMGLRQALLSYPPGTQGLAKLEENGKLETGLRHLHELFDQMEMPLSKRHIQRVLNAQVKGEEWAIGDLINLIHITYASMSGELEGRLFLGVRPALSKYYGPLESLVNSDVLTKFPSAVYEMDESAKCVALGRSTAAVFHLMRVMEIGVRSVAACLGIPDPVKPSERNWGVTLRKIKEAMDARNSARALAWGNSNDKEFFESAYASLDAVKNAWRNTTMHVGNKYSEEEALHILVAVHGFMKMIASRLDEQGQPLA